AVARLVAVDQRVDLLRARPWCRHLAEAQREAEIPAEAVQAGAQQGRLDELAATRALTFEERAEDARERGEGGDVVAEPTADVRWRSSLGREHRSDARARPEPSDV